jgi:hypothetical protein
MLLSLSLSCLPSAVEVNKAHPAEDQREPYRKRFIIIMKGICMTGEVVFGLFPLKNVPELKTLMSRSEGLQSMLFRRLKI